MKYLAIIGLIVLGACAGDPATRATNALAIACDSYATVLDQITPLRREGKLSDAIVKRVDSANTLVDPVCKPGSVVDPAKAVGIVEQGIGLLKTVKESI